jgi:hypothetical protein
MIQGPMKINISIQLALSLLMILCLMDFTKSYYIYTFAGNGTPGYYGDGGPATSAELNGPFGGLLSTNNSLYIADSSNNVVRLVYPNGTITTFAGNGNRGYSGDGGPATNASLNGPSGIAQSENEDIFICDTNNNAIRVVFPNGTISTYAGGAGGKGYGGYGGDDGPAIDALFYNPTDVIIMSLTGELYISDTFNNVIRVVDKNGNISRFAGNTMEAYTGDGGPARNASFYWPYGLAFSSKGDLYIADYGNNVIRVVYRNGTIETFAGNGNQGYSGDGGPAVDASLNSPVGVAVSKNGEVYISETYNNRLRVVYVNGTINTIAGNGIGSYSENGILSTNAELNLPAYIELSPTGEIYIFENNNNIVQILVNSTSSECSYHGTFQNQQYCICNSGYFEKQCNLTSCFGIKETQTKVCSAHGVCGSLNNCTCNSGYTGFNCQLNICYGINETSSNVCSGHGDCTSPDKCVCNRGFTGRYCQFKLAKLAYLLLLLLLIPLVVLTILFFWLIKRGYLDVKKRIRKENEMYERLLQYEMSETDDKHATSLDSLNLIIRLEELELNEKINEGTGGIVYKGIWCQKKVAIKKLKVPDEHAFVREVYTLSRLRHPNILELYGYSIDSKGYPYIITEFMDKGSLDNLLYNIGLVEFEKKIKILLDIAQGMKYLHERNFIHRDLKPQNVLIDNDNVCKICDFGVAKIVNQTLTVGVIGTWQYMAPEVMNATETYDEKCDVYSFAIMMHEIFTLSRPYVKNMHISQFSLGLKILNGYRPEIPPEVFVNETTENSNSTIEEFFLSSNQLPNSLERSNDIIVRLVKMYFALCVSCWANDSSERPPFTEIVERLQMIQDILSNDTNPD